VTQPADLRPVARGLEHVRVHQLDADVWGLRLPLPYRDTASVNAYLLALDDGYCLVDCGTSLDPGWDVLEHALGLAGTGPEELRLLVGTHLHADHVGLAATVVERTGCDYLHGLGPHTIDDALRDPAVPLADRRAAARREGIPANELDHWVDNHLADDVWHERQPPRRLLVGGDTLRTRAGTWTVVPIAGHSPAQIALFEERRRWVISADLAYDIAHPFFEYGWTLDPYAEHLASLDRVAALEPRMLLPGHGRPADDAPERLAAARRATEALATNLLAALSQTPRSAYELAVETVPDAEDNNRRQAFISTALCTLEHLERHGRITAHDDGVRRWSV
jgi:glyoxylase-like metal-dependent hydrolase (beta-lactamase superfamily II)